MKNALIAAVCLVLVAVVVAENARQRPTRRPIKRCNDGEDCEEDECCVGIAFLKGTCRRRGGEGAHCNGDEFAMHGKYLVRCPCTKGLSCIAEEEKETVFGKIRINERCQKEGVSPASPEPEVTTSEILQFSTEEERVSTEAPEESR